MQLIMSPDAGEPQWQKGPLADRLQRTYATPFGAERHEVFAPRLLYRRVTDRFAEVQRTVHIWGQADDPDTRFIQEMLQEAEVTYGNKVRFFLDPQNNIILEVKIPALGEATVNIIDSPTHEVQRGSEPFDAYVKAKYNSSGLQTLTLQGDIVQKFEPGKPNLVDIPDWKEAARLLVNYIETADPASLATDYTILTYNYQSFIECHFSSPTLPLLKSAAVIATELIGKILDIFPEVARDHISELFSSANAERHLQLGLLKEAVGLGFSENHLIGKFRIDDGEQKFLTYQLNDLIDMLTPDDMYTLRLLKIEDFNNFGYAWCELEEEEGMINPIASGTFAYGSVHNIQGDELSVERRQDTLLVKCMKKRGRTRWEASVPLSLPIDQINQIIGNLDTDFRNVKDLIGNDFKEIKA